MAKLVQKLPDGPLDIVGDVHGEWSALQDLLQHLGYNMDGEHPEGRHLVFVGDLCDRGPDSPAILAWLAKVMPKGNVLSILGNHEINLLLNVPKDGSGWFFPSRHPYDEHLYAPWQKAMAASEQQQIIQQLSQWPLVLEREDIRVVHAAWLPEAMAILRTYPDDSDLLAVFQHYDGIFQSAVQQMPWYGEYLEEKTRYHEAMLDPNAQLPLLRAFGEYESLLSRFNPISAVTTGIEAPVDEGFFSGGRWRYSSRLPWWESYQEDTPVVFGHYWRAWKNFAENEKPTKKNWFQEASNEWLGPKRNAFCVDFSVGARWRDRKANVSGENSVYRLAALRWPENVLVFDDGQTSLTL